MRKVFDCTDMPRNVNRIFMDNTDAGNDVFVEYYVCDKDGDINGEGEQGPLDLWLIENGADPGESVIIKHWW